MKRRRSLLSLLVLTCLYMLVAAAATAGPAQPVNPRTDAATPPTWTPSWVLPEDTAMVWCLAEDICYQISATDPDASDSLKLSLLEGPISIPDQVFGYTFTTSVCFRPETAGDYTFVWQLVDEQQHVLVDTVVFSLELGTLPTIEDQSFSAVLCDLREDRHLQLVAEGSDLTWSLISGPGSLDQNGLLTYRPDTSGTFHFRVAVENICGTDTALISDAVVLNLPPYCLPFDSAVYLCDPAEICFEIVAFDPENDAIQIQMLEGLGTFEQTTDTSGLTCFTPADLEYFRYRFIYYSADSCVLDHAEKPLSPNCCIDTVFIDVYITQEGELACPGDTIIDLCVPPDQLPDQICIPGFMSTWTTTQVTLGALTDGVVCFSPDTLGVYTLGLIGSDSCGHADTCTMTVTLNGNLSPVVDMADDFSVELCLEESSCFPAEVFDLDGTVSVTVTPDHAHYHAETGEVCIGLWTPGVYVVVLTAVDNCGAITQDTTIVTAVAPEQPTVDLGDDRTIFLCQPEEVCIEAVVTGDSDIVTYAEGGTYYPETGKMCFTPQESGVYKLVLVASNLCQYGDVVDSVHITVTFGTPPVVTGQPDSAVSLCTPQPICVTFAVTDVDNDIVSITTNYGAYADGQVCFLPDGPGLYEVIVTAIDACEFTAADTMLVTVDLGRPPVITGLPDTSVYLCYPSQICLPLSVTDPDGDLVSVTTSRGTYANGQICFVPYSAALYKIIVTATDACGNVTVDTALVDVKTDQGINLVCPGDTTVFLCEPDTLCFPIYGIPEGLPVVIDGLASWWDEETQSVCFFSDCCLENTLTVSVVTPCGSRSCEFTVYVQTNTRPLVLMPNDTTIFLCEPAGSVCVPVGISDIDDNIASVAVEGGTYDDYRHTICIDLNTGGQHLVTVTVTDSCGAVRTDEMTVTVRTNEPPFIASNLDNNLFEMCALEMIQIPVLYGDPDGPNPVLSSNDGSIVYLPEPQGDSLQAYLNYVPTVFGEQCVTITATDSCGATADVTICITVTEPAPVAIECPSSFGTVLCGPGQVCLDVPIIGDPISVTTTRGSWANDQLCIDATATVSEEVMVVAVGECMADTCRIMVNIDVLSSPEITCPEDDTVLVCGPDTMSYEVQLNGVTGPGELVTVNPPAWVVRTSMTVATVHVPVVEPGTQTITVTYLNPPCEPATCTFSVTAEFNTAPVLAADDASFKLCELREVCVPLYIKDLDGNITAYNSTLGTIELLGAAGSIGTTTARAFDRARLEDTANARLCFTPEAFGSYDITITIVDECGEEAQQTITVNVIEKSHVAITCPTEPFVYCDAAEHCIPLPIEGPEFEVYTSMGTWLDGQLCVSLEGPGVYDITVIADASCNSDTCTVTVNYLEPVQVACGVTDTTIFACDLEPMTVVVPVTIAGQDASITVTPAGVTYADGFVSVPVSAEGTIEVTVAAANVCSEASCTFTVTVDANQPPVATTGADTTITICTLAEVCIPYAATDVDDNIRELRTSLGVVSDGHICFTPPSFGQYELAVTVTDSCGAFDADTILVNVVEGAYATIDCPLTTISKFIDVPDSVHVPIMIMPTDAAITVLPYGSYNAVTGEFTAYLEATGLHNFTIIAEAECNVDTCTFSIDVQQYVPPIVDCISTLDTALCLVHPDTLCVPVTIIGSEVQVLVSEPAYYTDGAVCIPVTEPGEYVVDITAFNDRDTATCTSTLIVTGGTPPILEMPDELTLNLCEPGQACFDVLIEDTEFDIAEIEVSQGQYNIETGQLCFDAEVSGQYVVVVTVRDDCDNSITDTTQVTVVINEAPTVALPDGGPLFVCELTEICIEALVTDDGPVTVTTSLGAYDAETDKVCFTPQGPGLYTIILEAVDDCGILVADTVAIDLSVNSAPTVSGLQDSSVYLCYPTEICLPVDVVDLDDNIANISVSRGSYKNGSVCFVPYGAGTFQTIITVTDECGETAADTAYVTVRTDQEIDLVCPNDTVVFLCEPDTLCFPIGGIPAGAQVEVDAIASWWDEETQSACFWSDCCLENTLTVSVTTACGTHTCEFTVSVQTNTPPLVLMPNDTSVVQCDFERICIPVGVSDIDGNFRDLTVSHGTYDAYRHELCFTPDSSGTYVIQVTATDSCDHSRTDELVVNVRRNDAPTVSIEDIAPAEYCELPAEICLNLSVVDTDNNIESITTSLGTITDNKVCFVPTVFGDHQIIVTVTDTCGLSSADTSTVTLIHNESWVEIGCPTEPLPEVALCSSGQVCIPLPSVTGADYTLEVSAGAELIDNTICFPADTTGLYTITLTGISDCNTEECVLRQPITIYEPFVFEGCPSDTGVFLCAADTLEIAFSVIGGGHALDQVTVNPPAWINGSTVFVPVLAEGARTVTLIADSYLCTDDTCSFTVTADFNSAPTLVLGADVTLVECVIPEVCVKFTVTDADDNVASITASQGAIVGDSSVCFTASTWGTHSIVVTVTDECGLTDKDTVLVTVTEGAHASIQCPDGTQFASICGPGEVCVFATVTPSDAEVDVLPNGHYNPATGKICTYVDHGGTHPITIIATSQCGADTCTFNLEIDLGLPPDITCPGAIDTLLCLAQPDTLCFPVTVAGTGVSVVVSPIGYYAAGMVCVPISQPGDLTVKLKATGSCGVDSCSVNISVSADQVPQLFLPQGLVFERCPDDTDQICIDGIYATDTESSVVIGKVCGPGTFTALGGDSGTVCFLPTTFGQYQFCFEATDGCHTVIDTMLVNVTLKDDCDVCLRLSVDGGSCTPVGLMHQVALNIETNDEIAGFDLLMHYDKTALSFQTATMNGGAGDDWEYFTWNLNVGDGTGGLVKFVAIADRNNGSAHPPVSAYSPQGALVFIQFLVANDQNLGGMYIPIGFRWLDCTDNSFSDRTGAILYIDSRIFDAEGNLVWDEFNDAAYPESARAFGVGAPDSCIVETGKTQPLRCAEFYSGAVCIIHPDSIDARGDVNLNNIAYEIADAVVFTNYFIKGLSAFTINTAGQIAATDVNADGLTLTVADLTTLIRVIVGDANPIPKVTPYAETATVYAALSDGVLRVSKETAGSVGAAYFVFELGDGAAIGTPTVNTAASTLGCKCELADGQLKVLLSDIGTGSVSAGRQDLFELPLAGALDVRLSHVELVDYYGQPYEVASKALLPTEYELMQNYPNPFNPSTTISFAMPHAGDWRLRIFNINGAVVNEFAGNGDGGRVDVVWNGDNSEGARTASGVYFYRLETSDFSDTRKMVLLK